MKDEIWSPVYRRCTGALWSSVHVFPTREAAEDYGVRVAQRMPESTTFVGACDVSAAIEHGFRLGMCHKADEVQPRLADLELRIAKAQEALGASAI